MTTAKITRQTGYQCAPSGYDVKTFACGEVVSGQVAEWALADGAASRMFDPRTDAQVQSVPETKKAHIAGGRVEKGGHNAAESQIKERPPAPKPTRGRPRK